MNKKTKVPELLAIYNSIWFGHRWSHYVWRQAFTSNPVGKLPSYTSPVTVFSDDLKLQVKLLMSPANTKGKRWHRVFVNCPRCDECLPAGRIHQHTC